eukprot:gene1526-1932_t
MHVYIILGIGVKNSIGTFISWNCMCTAVSAILFSSVNVARGSLEDGPQLSIFGSSGELLVDWPVFIITFLALNVPPFAQLFGWNEFATLSHSWFVPGGTGPSYVLFNRQLMRNVPEEDNGAMVTLRRSDTIIDEVAKHLG